MTSYLLLRNNKESGPFSLEQLIGHGLKAYDLIWVNGKSAAWRYPGEIPELIQFAPPVEEQPYDRFFKKPSEEKKESIPVKQKEIVAEYVAPVKTEEEKKPVPETIVKKEEKPQEYTAAKSEPPAFSPKKSVFVTMPGRSLTQEEVPAQKPLQEDYTRYQPSQPVATDHVEPVTTVAKTITITENPIAAEIKYSQPLDEIKEMYVKTLQERRQKIANKAFLLQATKKVAVVLAIVGAGVVIGISIKSNDGNKLVAATGATEQQLLKQAPDPELNSEPVVNLPEEQVADEQPAETPRESSRIVKESSVPMNTPVSRETTPREQKIFDSEEKQAQKPVEFLEEKKAVNNPLLDQAPRVETNDRTGERTRKTRNEASETEEQPAVVEDEPVTETRKPKAVLSNKGLASQVSVKTNNYKIVAFGGIRDLQVTVHNESKYVLDKVLVELQYLKPSLEPFRVDVITFKSVSPNGTLTIRMPDTNRGIKVKYRILNILSTQSARDLADL
jgi:hypothetical protein